MEGPARLSCGIGQAGVNLDLGVNDLRYRFRHEIGVLANHPHVANHIVRWSRARLLPIAERSNWNSKADGEL